MADQKPRGVLLSEANEPVRFDVEKWVRSFQAFRSFHNRFEEGYGSAFRSNKHYTPEAANNWRNTEGYASRLASILKPYADSLSGDTVKERKLLRTIKQLRSFRINGKMKTRTQQDKMQAGIRERLYRIERDLEALGVTFPKERW